MHNTYCDLDQRAEFEPVNGHVTLDVVYYSTRAPTSKRREWKHDEISSDWLHEDLKEVADENHISNFQARLRVLIVTPRQDFVAPVVTFPLSRPVYEEIEQVFGIDEAVRGYATAEGVITSEFKAFDGGYGIFSVLKRKHFVATFDPVSATTYVLIRGSCLHERHSFLTLLQQLQEETPLVTAVAVVWATIALQMRARSFVDKKVAILTIEGELGLHVGFRTMQDSLTRDDLQRLTQKLMLPSNAWDITALEFYLDLIARLTDVKKHFVLKSLVSMPQASETLQLRMSQLRSLITGLQAGKREIQPRANIVLQTTYNLISQRDNEINAKIAAAAQKSAEATQRDSSAQKQIATDMREVAVRTYLDSANMKTMTLINLCCLPGTFAATFFSTGFFNFTHDSSTTIVSPYIWPYVVITIVLTAVLFVSWHLGYRKMRKPLEIDPPSVTELDSTEKSLVSPPDAMEPSKTPRIERMEAASISSLETEPDDDSQVEHEREHGGRVMASADNKLITWFLSRSPVVTRDGLCLMCYAWPPKTGT